MLTYLAFTGKAEGTRRHSLESLLMLSRCQTSTTTGGRDAARQVSRSDSSRVLL